jgi:two-component system, OmpR family, heavy metal sensor histidine kinase CusS
MGTIPPENEGDRRRRLVELVVHDLRNPLSALLGNLELLRDELGDEVAPAIRVGLDDCAALTTRALTLVATVLDVAELEAGDLRVDPRPVDVADLVAEAAARNRAGVRLRDVRVDVDIPAGLTASLDPDLAGRVLEHLFDNAVRYARRAGRVAVAARVVDGDAVEIAIGNDGPPVAERERAAIFGRHYRAEARRASAHRGLGLYFCRLAVEAHGGTISVEERDGLGAVFVARIPNG